MKKIYIVLSCFIGACHAQDYRITTHPIDNYIQHHSYQLVPKEQTSSAQPVTNTLQESIGVLTSSVQEVISNTIEMGTHAYEQFVAKQKLQEARLTLSRLELLTDKSALERKSIINNALITIAQHDEDINSLTHYISFVEKHEYKTDKEAAGQLYSLLEKKEKIADQQNKQLINNQEEKIRQEMEKLRKLQAQINTEKNKVLSTKNILSTWNKDLQGTKSNSDPLITTDEKGRLLHDGVRPV